MSKKRLKVVIQQQVLPSYRVPFFEELGKRVDLTVCVAPNTNIPGVASVHKDCDYKHSGSKPFKRIIFSGGDFSEELSVMHSPKRQMYLLPVRAIFNIWHGHWVSCAG